MCYATQPSRGSPAFVAVGPILVDNQFGPQQLRATMPSDLCVPALAVSAGALAAEDVCQPVLTAAGDLRRVFLGVLAEPAGQMLDGHGAQRRMTAFP